MLSAARAGECAGGASLTAASSSHRKRDCPYVLSLAIPACGRQVQKQEPVQCFTQHCGQLSWKPSHVEIVFRDIYSCCELESGDVIDILDVATLQVAHIVLRIGSSDALPSQGGSQYNALVLFHDEVQMRHRNAFDLDSLSFILSNLKNSLRNNIDTILYASKTIILAPQPMVCPRSRREFSTNGSVDIFKPPTIVKLPLSSILTGGKSLNAIEKENPFILALNSTLIDGLFRLALAQPCRKLFACFT